MTPTAISGYNAALESAARVDGPDRVRLRIHGPDRLKFLHNLTTNDINSLKPGAGREAFVTSPQGKTLGRVTVLANTDDVLLRSDPGTLETLLDHFKKYGPFDDVAWEDLAPRTSEWHVCGPASARVLEALGLAPPGAAELDHAASTWNDQPVEVVRESPLCPPGFTLIGPLGLGAAFEDLDASIRPCRLGPPAFEALRIEAGTPRFGSDITVQNLPQEIDRNARAIHFSKGCYLGQETVARIDALGHVNRVLRGLRLSIPAAPGTELLADGKPAGIITSSAESPGWNQPVALGFVRTTACQAGRTLAFRTPEGEGAAVVAELPMRPPAGTAE